MNRANFYDNLNKYNNIQHSSVYGDKNYQPDNPHKKHKYIKIENGRYIYPEDLEKQKNNSTNNNASTKNTNDKTNVQKDSANNDTENQNGGQNNISGAVGGIMNTANRSKGYNEIIQTKKYDTAKKEKKYDKNFVNAVKFNSGLTNKEVLNEYKKYLQDPVGYPKKFIANMLYEYGKGGNVNLNIRPEVPVEKLNEAGFDAGDEGYATVFSSTFSNEDETLAYNFTPIMVDPKTGEFLGVINKDEFDQYCEDVVGGYRDDDYNLQIGHGYVGKNAIQEAEGVAKRIHEMHETLHELNRKMKENK